MAYTKQTWVDNNSLYPASAARLGNIEQGVYDAHISADDLKQRALSPMQYGAVGNGVADEQAALAACFADAKIKKRPVIIDRLYKHSTGLVIDGISVIGLGLAAELQATNPAASKIVLGGTGPRLENVKITSPNTTIRIDNDNSVSVIVDGNLAANRFVVRGCHIDTSAHMGIAVRYGASYGTVSKNIVENTLADGIGVWDGSNNVAVSGNIIRNSSDDSISVESYYAGGVRVGTTSAQITVTDNVIDACNSHLRLTGSFINCSGNILKNSLGINVDAWGDGVGLSGGDVHQVVVANNVIYNPGGWHGIFVAGRSGAGGGVSNVSIVNNHIEGITNTSAAGISIPLGYVGPVTVRGNQIVNCAQFGIRVGENASTSPPIDITIKDNMISLTASTGIHVDTVLGALRISHNTFREIAQASAGYAVNVTGGTPAISVVSDNHLLGGVNHLVKLIGSVPTLTEAARNYTQPAVPIGP